MKGCVKRRPFESFTLYISATPSKVQMNSASRQRNFDLKPPPSQRTKEDWEGTLDQEIQKLSKDTDAILESIRRVADPSPTGAVYRLKNTEMADFESRLGTEPFNDGDDDLSDTDTVSSLIKRELVDELKEADLKFIKKKENRSLASKTGPSPEAGVDESLIKLMAIVWTVVILIAGYARKHMLQSDGKIVLPFSS